MAYGMSGTLGGSSSDQRHWLLDRDARREPAGMRARDALIATLC
jgi:hypothetical protein